MTTAIIPGFVYLFRADTGPVKIGRSEDPQRHLALLSASPVAIHLLHQIATDDMKWLERHLQRRFLHRRVRNEWFALTPEDLTSLQAVDVWNRPPGVDESRVTLYVTIDADLKQGLQSEAKARDRTLGEMVEAALVRLLAECATSPAPPEESA